MSVTSYTVQDYIRYDKLYLRVFESGLKSA